MPYDPRAGAPREGFVFVVNDLCPGEVGEIPDSPESIDHYAELGWRRRDALAEAVEALADAFDPDLDDVEVHGVIDPSAPVDETPAPEGATHTSEED